MKRDNDLIRDLLMEFEAREDFLIVVAPHLSMSLDERQRWYHVELMCDAGLMTPVGKGTFRITHQGHDFLEATRDQGAWERTKAAVSQTGGNATLDILKQISVAFLKRKIKDHTGLEI